MIQILSMIKQEMASAGVEYHLLRNKKSKPTYPYFVGELLPTIPTTEDGKKEYTMIVEGFNRGSQMDLLKEAEKIEDQFPSVEGNVAIVSGEAIAIFHAGSQIIDSGEEELQKIQITLAIKSWKGR